MNTTVLPAEVKTKPALLEFAYMGNLGETLAALKTMAIPEDWEYSVPTTDRAPLPILHGPD